MSVECYERLCLYHSKDEPYCTFDECVIYCKHCGEPLTNLLLCDFCGAKVNEGRG